MCVTIRNSMHGVLLLPSLKKQQELIQGPIIFLHNQRNYWKKVRPTDILMYDDDMLKSSEKLIIVRLQVIVEKDHFILNHQIGIRQEHNHEVGPWSYITNQPNFGRQKIPHSCILRYPISFR